MYYWDPRPKEFQIKNNVEHFNSFICNLQCINNLNRGNKLSMWQTLFKITYKDFSLEEEDIDYYSSQVTIFENCLEGNISKFLKDHVLRQVPGTEEQSDSSVWFQQHLFRITASRCKIVTSLGEKISRNIDARKSCYNWIKNSFWFPSNILIQDMKYGIESESLAVNLYMSNTGNKVISSGPWVNKNYIHLAVSPDGLIYNDQNKLHGIIEIKCLKIFRNRTIEQLILYKPPKLSKQCFKLNDKNISLKRSHLYFYQVQLQLLITEADYCDFIVYSSARKIYVERILKDNDVQRQIIKYTKLFWEKILIPEYFIMRIPREPLPTVL